MFVSLVDVFCFRYISWALKRYSNSSVSTLTFQASSIVSRLYYARPFLQWPRHLFNELQFSHIASRCDAERARSLSSGPAIAYLAPAGRAAQTGDLVGILWTRKCQRVLANC